MSAQVINQLKRSNRCSQYMVTQKLCKMLNIAAYKKFSAEEYEQAAKQLKIKVNRRIIYI